MREEDQVINRNLVLILSIIFLAYTLLYIIMSMGYLITAKKDAEKGVIVYFWCEDIGVFAYVLSSVVLSLILYQLASMFKTESDKHQSQFTGGDLVGTSPIESITSF